MHSEKESTIVDSTAAAGRFGPITKRRDVAFISVSVRPYRLDLLQRIASEMPDIHLHSLFDRDWTESRWTPSPLAGINPTHFGGREFEGYAMGRLRDSLSDWRRGGRITRYVDGHEIRVVILNGYGSVSFIRVIRDCHRLGIPLFLRADSNINGDPSRGWFRDSVKRSLLRWVLRRTAGVMPMSQFGEQFFAKYGAVSDDFYWVPCEPDYSRFASVRGEEVGRFQEDRGLAPGRHRFLVCGQLVGLKRVDMAIDAFVGIASRLPEWDLVVVGSGPLKQELARRVPASLGDRVRFLGFCSPEDVRLAYKLSDVLVVPSDVDAFPVVVLEAMGAGLPVVASNVVGSASEVVVNGVSGRIFEAGDVRALSECLLDVGDPRAIKRYQAEVPRAIEAWRRRADPVEGIRRALASYDVLGG